MTPERERDVVPEPEIMPRWVPLAIGIVLVTLGALAVFTGLRFREGGLAGIARPRATPPRSTGAAPSGEPDAGASLVMPGNAVPDPNAPVSGGSRAIVTGGPKGVQSTVRIWARRGMITRVVPADAVVHVNEMPIGQANQFDSQEEIYDFPQPGSYDVRITAPGRRERRFTVTADENAKQDVALIEVNLGVLRP